MLNWLDRLNRWLYHRHPPLNWLTKRRHMEITARLPARRHAGERLWNSSGVGQVLLDEAGRPMQARLLDAQGPGVTRFLPREADQRVCVRVPGEDILPSAD